MTPDRKSTRLNSSHTVIYPLSLHDALPIFRRPPMTCGTPAPRHCERERKRARSNPELGGATHDTRSEEHTSELQSHSDLPSFPTRRSSDLPPTAHDLRHGRPPSLRARAQASAKQSRIGRGNT